jgi:hypothetical protein
VRDVSNQLNDRDRLAVRDAVEEILADQPRDLASLGCLVVLPGVLILLVVPVVGRFLGIGSGLATAAIIVGVILLAVGVAMWMGAPRFLRGRSTAAVEAALRQLQQEGEEREVLLRAATLLLTHAHATVGATTSLSLSVDEARRRLGTLLPLVVEVERYLLAEGEIYPVFSSGEGKGEAT